MDSELGLGILNVGAGHNRIKFDPNDPVGMKQAAAVVKDMLKLGYAILIEVPDGQGGMTTERVKSFREDTYEYIIGDKQEKEVSSGRRGSRPGRGRVGVSATKTRGVAVARTSGG